MSGIGFILFSVVVLTILVVGIRYEERVSALKAENDDLLIELRVRSLEHKLELADAQRRLAYANRQAQANAKACAYWKHVVNDELGVGTWTG